MHYIPTIINDIDNHKYGDKYLINRYFSINADIGNPIRFNAAIDAPSISNPLSDYANKKVLIEFNKPAKTG